jgi:phosphoribosylamine--glycine ligase
MKKYKIPTAACEIFSDYKKASEYIKTAKHPLVIKADGLAAGKGVIICATLHDSETALKEIMKESKFGLSGDVVVIEEFLIGQEVTILAFCDGKTLALMPAAQDHKRLFDNDLGLNTGGMGAYSPSPLFTDEVAKRCNDTIFQPTLNALITEERTYKGIIYFGLILTDNGPKVIEYNSRFGDPEAQVILPLLDTELLTIFEACVNGTLDSIDIKWKEKSAACVILASGGYPEEYNTGYEITGLKEVTEQVFHSGTEYKDGKILTSGGRVLGVTGMGNSLNDAVQNAYDNIEKIDFTDMHFRKDIGK